MTGDAVWHNVTPDYFDAVAVAGGVAVRMGTNVAATLHHHADRLVRVLEGENGDERTLAHLFPDVYADRAASDGFRLRHAARLRDSTAPRRVRDQLAAAPNHVLSPPEVHDWLVTSALARYVDPPPRSWWRRRSRGRLDLAGRWFLHVQNALILAANPELAQYDLRL